MERMPNSACNRGGRYSAEVAYLDTTRFHIRATGALPQWRSKPALPRGLGPGRGRVCRFESRSSGPRIPTSQDFLSGGSRSRRMFGAKSSGHQQPNVPRYLLKAKFSHEIPISWERNFPALRFGNSVIFSQFSIVWRRAAAVVFGSPLADSVSGYSH